MWVKNQDGLAVVEVQALALDPTDFTKPDIKNVRVWGSISDHDYIMGVYNTLEDAKAVLADFAHAIISRNTTVFVMPRAIDVQSKEVQ